MILLVCFSWTLVLILGARILLYLHRSSRLNPHRLALFISSWFSIFPMIALVVIYRAIDVLLLGILVALIIFSTRISLHKIDLQRDLRYHLQIRLDLRVPLCTQSIIASPRYLSQNVAP